MVEKEINHLVDTDIIEKIKGKSIPRISPIFTPLKKTGTDIRLCVDMREANAAVKREWNTLPTIEERIIDLNGANIFSKLVLRSSNYIRSRDM